MIDVTTGDRVEMARRLRARNPDAHNFAMRVGYTTAGSIGASLRRSDEP